MNKQSQLIQQKRKRGRPSLLEGEPDIEGDTFIQFERHGNSILWHLWFYDEDTGWTITQQSGTTTRNRGRIMLGHLRRIERKWSRGYQTRVDSPIPSQREVKPPRTH